MSAPEMPVIYENPRFDAATPTLQPVINRAIRYGALLMLEWGTLTLIEDAPRYLKIATVVIAILVLAVHESWPWLRMRDKRLYPILMGILIVGYVGIFGYAWAAEIQSPHAVNSLSTTPPTEPKLVTNPSISWNGDVGPVTFSGIYGRTGGRIDIFVEWGGIIGQAPVVGAFLNWDGRRYPIESKERAVRNAELKTTIGMITEPMSGQFVFQIGKDNLDLNLDQSYIFRLVFVSQDGEEQSYPFAMVSSRAGPNGKVAPAILIDPSVFIGRGNRND